MSKPKEAIKSPSSIISTYQVERKDSGYYIIRHQSQDGKVIKTESISEPDVLIITMANLEKFIRKDLGL